MGTLAVPAGTVFGRWTVIEEAPRISARSDRAMHCRCECGTEKVLRLAALRAGTTTSCGCGQREGVRADVPPGTVFGRLTVLGEAPRMGADRVRAMLCQCECGKQKAVRLGALRSGNTKSCGCVNRGVGTKNPAQVEPGEVPLYGEKAQGRVALVDDEDFGLVMQFRWCVKERAVGREGIGGPYAITRTRDAAGRQVAISMHALIMGRPYIDHVDGDGLNNRRSNLRPATGTQNQGNRRPTPGCSSQFKGVRWYAPRRKWNARIGYEGRQHHLGYFEDEIAAARAYDEAARRLFGEYARPNFPDGKAA